MNLRITILSALLGLFACGAALAEPQPGDIQITDPAEVARLGFDPATDEVWRAPDFDDRQMLQERLTRETSPQTYPDPLVDPIWASVQATDFHFRGQSAIYPQSSTFSLSCSAGSPVRIADAPIVFPNDHRVTWMDVWAVDQSATAGVEVALYEICQNIQDPSRRSVIQLAAVDTGVAANPGPVFLNRYSGPNRWVHSSICSHMVRATFSTCAAGTDVRLQKVRVLWDYD